MNALQWMLLAAAYLAFAVVLLAGARDWADVKTKRLEAQAFSLKEKWFCALVADLSKSGSVLLALPQAPLNVSCGISYAFNGLLVVDGVR